LGRALREGCTPAEVLDALLMAFPMLGLAKIVWAVDIILAMDLPEFQPGALGAEGEWHDVMPTKGFKVGDTQRVECDGRGLFIHRAEKEWRVYDSRCPHQTTNIPHLALEGHTLTCPKHQWVFDLQSGDCIKKGNSPLRQWPSKVVKGRLLARW
jgi:nitrite reductase/ring-hydroxylating ferredoxin subunit